MSANHVEQRRRAGRPAFGGLPRPLGGTAKTARDAGRAQA